MDFVGIPCYIFYKKLYLKFTNKETNIEKFIEKIKKVETKHWLSFSPHNLLDLPTETIINFLLI